MQNKQSRVSTQTMGLDTLEEYRIESENERDDWRDWLGRWLTFTGFIVFANAFLVALLFHQLLSFRNQISFAGLGGLVGVAGMLLRGNNREAIRIAAVAVSVGIAVTIAMNLLEARFGFLGMVATLLMLAWLISKFTERVRERL